MARDWYIYEEQQNKIEQLPDSRGGRKPVVSIVWAFPKHLSMYTSVLWTRFEVPSEMTPMERPVVVLYMELVAEFLEQGAFSRNNGNLT